MQLKFVSNKYKYLVLMFGILTLPGCQTTVENALSMNEAQESYDEGNLERAFRLTEIMAYDGNVHAQYALGFMYIKGAGTPRNETLGLKWIENAAKQGNAKALTALQMIDEQRNLTTQPFLSSS